MARMISSESKTIIGDREAFAALYPKAALGAVDLWHVLRNSDALAPSANMTEDSDEHSEDSGGYVAYHRVSG